MEKSGLRPAQREMSAGARRADRPACFNARCADACVFASIGHSADRCLCSRRNLPYIYLPASRHFQPDHSIEPAQVCDTRLIPRWSSSVKSFAVPLRLPIRKASKPSNEQINERDWGAASFVLLSPCGIVVFFKGRERDRVLAIMGGSDAPKTSDTSSRVCSAGSFADLSKDILNETFYNIIHDIIAKVHRDEKITRMRSAVTLARQQAEAEAGDNPEKKVRVETEGAIYDEGKVYLKGNPLATTKEIICPYCRLPRLLYPTAGVGAQPSPDPSREYCTKHPLISKPGYDVHGNPFATDKPKKKKKAATSANTPASSPPSTPDANSKQAAPEYPTIKCPNCPRYFQTNRVTAHLDRCMGISGRNTTRNRDGASATPSTSGPHKRPLSDGDVAPINPKKKKPNTPKKPGPSKPAPPSKLKNGATPDTMIAEEAAELAEASKDPSDDGIVKTEP